MALKSHMEAMKMRSSVERAFDLRAIFSSVRRTAGRRTAHPVVWRREPRGSLLPDDGIDGYLLPPTGTVRLSRSSRRFERSSSCALVVSLT